jgi:hypothetical protein
MKRREFLTSSVAAAGLGTLLTGVETKADDAPAAAREYYELKRYHLRRGQTDLWERFYRDAAIPAYNRAGVEKVGVFSVMVGAESPSMWVLMAHKSMDSVVSTGERMAADEEYQKAGAFFMNVPATAPSFIRVKSSLLAAFHGMPKLEVPALGDNNKSRIFELRTYESHNKKANHKKIEMFERGEIAIFRRNGLQPVFFGETLIGENIPNLTYMLVFENQAAHDQNWAKFVADPEWKKLSHTPGYMDSEIVSNISNMLLRPAAFSQI